MSSMQTREESPYFKHQSLICNSRVYSFPQFLTLVQNHLLRLTQLLGRGKYQSPGTIAGNPKKVSCEASEKARVT